MYHVPVLLQDCITGLNINPQGIYVDVTFGGGGHSREIIKHLTTGKLFAFDQDADAQANKIDDEKFVLIPHNFKYVSNYLRMYGVTQIDGLLADLGVSSHQFDVPERGFSTRFDAELDMRMSSSSILTAKYIVNEYEEKELCRVIKEYGEIDNARKLASVICKKRIDKPINSIAELKATTAGCVSPQKENQYWAQLFQALRIEVNQELDALKELLLQSDKLIKQGGRLVVMSYHSLEDRLVKNYIKNGKFEGEAEKDVFGNNISVPFKQITRKPIIPTEEEIQKNSRARSAKLRIAEKI